MHTHMHTYTHYQFMKVLLHMDPADRPSSAQSLESPYFEGLVAPPQPTQPTPRPTTQVRLSGSLRRPLSKPISKPISRPPSHGAPPPGCASVDPFHFPNLGPYLWPCTRYLACTLYPKPSTLDPKPLTLHPEP